MKAESLFELPENMPFADFFRPDATPWEWVAAVKPALKAFDFSTSAPPDIPTGVKVIGDVHFGEGVKLPAFAHIEGPAWIGAGTEIRPGAFIRGNVIIGDNCVIGNSCEYKNCLLMNNVQTPHYNYIGDSVLGSYAHLGAGVILSNLRLDQKNIICTTDSGIEETDMRKLGAMLGEHAEVGCNTSLQPGTILGKYAVVGPVMPFSGYLAEKKIAILRPQPDISLRRDLS